MNQIQRHGALDTWLVCVHGWMREGFPRRDLDRKRYALKIWYVYFMTKDTVHGSKQACSIKSADREEDCDSELAELNSPKNDVFLLKVVPERSGEREAVVRSFTELNGLYNIRSFV